MFYEKKMDTSFRFGDVIKGYITINTRIKKPFLNIENHDYNINVELPPFSVILSPCCSIGDRKITLAPLKRVRKSFFNNPHFDEDLTRINRRMDSKNVLSPEQWEKKSDKEKAEILKDKPVYTFVELFIYDENDLFPKYPIRRRGKTENISYYMIDFGNIYKLGCEEIISPKKAPIDSKLLQLSVQSRSELRDKIAYYFGRVPDEDKLLED